MKAIIVTGATSGIGYEVCRALLNENFRVIGIGHSKEKTEEAQKSLNKEFPEQKSLFFYRDLMQQNEIICLCDELSELLNSECDGKLHALINNAGCVRSWYTTTDEGIEQQLALNHLSGFLLAYRMMPFVKNAKGRVIFTSSNSHKKMKMRWNDIMFKNRYNPLLAYKQSKLCNLLTAYAINDRFVKEGIRAYGVDPGLVKTNIGNKQTGGLINLIWTIRKQHGVEPEIPARTYLYLCMQEEHPDGLYYYNSEQKQYSRHVNKENADRLFSLSEKLCGIDFL